MRQATPATTARTGGDAALAKRRLRASGFAAVFVVTAMVATLGTVFAATQSVASPTSQSFGYSGVTETFTVPDGVTQLSITLTGGEAGRGGADSTPAPPPGGYRGFVSGVMPVTPGQVLTIAVGQGGSSGTSRSRGSSDPAHYTDNAAKGGSNPFGEYRGGDGGVAGTQGSSGFGGAGGAATAITTNGHTIIAGGSGGSGGSGQYGPTQGRMPESSFTERDDTKSTAGETGITIAMVCNNAPAPGCDGGGSGGGGGGAQGGAQGTVEFGSGSSNEWFGYGGSPGKNATADITGLSAAYQFHSGNGGHGSVTISYAAGEPTSPTGVVGVPHDEAVAVGWTAPSDSGRADITDYLLQYAPASDRGTWTTVDRAASLDRAVTVTGLTNGTAYVFRVAAINAIGTGSFSVPSNPITPASVPAAVLITGITPGDGSASLAFTAAESAIPVLDYEYRVDDGDWVSAQDTSSPIRIAGLANGTVSSVQLRAVNAMGSGAVSEAVSVTPQAAPGAPNVTSVSATIGSIALSFTPGFTGGLPVNDYEYRLDGAAWQSAGTTTSPVTITGLADGTGYDVSLRAVTSAGAGEATLPASIMTPGAPKAPTISAVTAGDRSLSIAYSPADNGGMPVTSYEYRLGVAGTWTAASGLSSPIAVTGLTNGTVYGVQLRAVNAVGAGTASTSVPATPGTTPGAPVITTETVSGQDGKLFVEFTAPASDGGAAITGYEYSTDAGQTWYARSDGETTSAPLMISALSSDGETALQNGTTYRVELRAVNPVGPGAASAVADGMSVGTPAPPVDVAVVPEAGTLRVSFTPPANGGAAITAYEYRLGSGAWTGTATLGSTFSITGLANGTAYDVQVRAVNSEGASGASAAVSATPASAPHDAMITGATRADQALAVAVSISDGGSAITDWQYSTDGGVTWTSAGTSTSPLAVAAVSSDGSAVLNGTGYPVVVRAVNGIGVGEASAITLVAPAGAPSAPTVTAAGIDQGLEVGFAVDDNGSPLTGIQYRLDGGDWVDPGTVASPFTIRPLVNGTAYSVELRAVNSIGTGEPSTAVSATPATVPGSPVGIGVRPDDHSAIVSWTAPVSDGGSVVTGYTATAYPSATSTVAVATCTTVSLSCTITGLDNGTGYYLAVSATNISGTGPATSRVFVTPAARPGIPTVGTVTVGNSYLRVPFTPGSAGTSPISDYEYTLDEGVSWTSVGTTNSPIMISGLENGTEYFLALRAVSDAGDGDASAIQRVIPFTNPDAPDAATIVADGQNGQVVVSWVAPNNNGSTITSYTATAFSDPKTGTQVRTCSTTGAPSCTLTGLANGTTYYVSIQAGNAAGLSVRSAPRVSVTPAVLPGAVSAISGTPADRRLSLTWSAGSTGASAITDYIIAYSSDGIDYTTIDDGESVNRSVTATGLTNGTAYTFTITAVNSHGAGPAATSPPLTPGAVPGPAAVTSATPGYESVELTWSAPENDGGLPITGYRIVPSAGDPITVAATTETSYTIEGLTAGTWYSFTVAAINAAGAGPESAPSVPGSPYGLPGPVSDVSGRPGDGMVSLTWTAADTGGRAITDYIIAYSVEGSTYTIFDDGTSADTKTDVTALTNGTPYTFTVVAVNAAGSGPVSEPSVALIPSTVAGAPTGLVAVPGDAQVSLSWIAPVATGGAPVTAYRIETSSDNGKSWKAIGADVTNTTHTIDGLVNGVPVSFRVAAMNSAGTGLPTGPVTGTPRAVPGAPAITALSGTNHALSVVFAEPDSDGGSDIESYEYSLDGGATWNERRSGDTESPLFIGGLTNDVTYQVAIRAVNQLGFGPGSVPVDGSPKLEPIPIPNSDTELPELSAGDSLLVINGQARQLSVASDSGSVTLTGDGFTVRLAARDLDDGPLAIDSSGRLVLMNGGFITATGTGFLPGSIVDVWLFSTPTLIGEVTVNSGGTFSRAFAMPAEIEAGSHTVQLNGVLDDGSVAAVSLGVTVVPARDVSGVPAGPDAPDVPAVPAGSDSSDAPAHLPTTGYEPMPLLLVVLVLLAMGSGAMLVGRRRSRRVR